MDRHTGKGLSLALGVGVGLGLIAGAALTAVAQQPRELTNEQITQKARTLGMVPVNEMPKAAAPGTAQPKAEASGSPASAPGPATAPAAGQGTAQATAPAAAQAAPTAPAQPAPPPPPAKVTISVAEGAVFSDVVSEMQQAGLIKDPDAFMARAQETGAVTRIRVGPHLINRGADADQILDILTSPSNE